MAKTGWRFEPPHTPLTPEMRWVLVRAFGPADRAADVHDPRGAVDLAGRMALGGRIASRNEHRALADELGTEPAGRLQAWRMASAARALQIENTLVDIATVAAEWDYRMVALKGAALVLAGTSPVGARSAQDLDLLLEPAEARQLFAELQARGYRTSGSGEHEHQLPALFHPRGVALELHLKILGVRLSGEDSATLEDLEREGLSVPLDSIPGRVGMPDRALLTAHALVHGLVQHGWTPDAYPLARMFADLQDLARSGSDAGEVEQIRDWLARDLPAIEIEAAQELVAALGEGDTGHFERAPGSGAAESLAHHLVAGLGNEEYRRSLRFKMVGWPLSDHSPGKRATSWLRGALWPTPAELDGLYGTARGPLGRAGQRIRRPIHLAVRAAGHALAWLRRKFEQPAA